MPMKMDTIEVWLHC